MNGCKVDELSGGNTSAGHLTLLRERIAPVRRLVNEHPLYRGICTMGDLRIFLESHVYAVWDFMSLLKALQRVLTSVDVPWLPSRFPE